MAATTIADVLAHRLGQILSRRGQSVQIISSGNSTSRTVRGQVRILSPGEKYQWFTSAQATGWALPALMIHLAGDDPAQVGDTLAGDAINRIQTGNGRVVTVRAVYRSGIGGVTVWTLLLAA